jgi:hypothetical protein
LATNPSYVKLFLTKAQSLMQELDNAEWGCLTKMLCFVRETDNVLVDNDGMPMTSAELTAIFGMSRTQTNYLLRKLIERGAVKVIERGARRFFRVDPQIGNRYPTRHGDLYQQWRLDVLDRDGYACVECGSPIKLDVHHIKHWRTHPELRLSVDNGITLCRRCHGKKHPRMELMKARAGNS